MNIAYENRLTDRLIALYNRFANATDNFTCFVYETKFNELLAYIKQTERGI